VRKRLNRSRCSLECCRVEWVQRTYISWRCRCPTDRGTFEGVPVFGQLKRGAVNISLRYEASTSRSVPVYSPSFHSTLAVTDGQAELTRMAGYIQRRLLQVVTGRRGGVCASDLLSKVASTIPTQDKLVPVNGRCRSAAGKVTVGLALSHWLRISGYPPTDS